MVYRGTVQNGVIVPDNGAKLVEGQTVSIRPLRGRSARAPRAGRGLPTLYERLKSVAGIISGLPADWASQHDHYIHGTPKRK